MSRSARRRGKVFSLGGLLFAVALAAAACSSSGSASPQASSPPPSSSATSPSSSAGNSPSASSAVAYAKAQLAKYAGAVTALPDGGPAISGVSAFKGRTVWYVPILVSVPFFGEEEQGLRDALHHLGMNLEVCDAHATPTGASACINQAVSSGAAGIVTAAFPYGFAANAFANAQSHHVPVVLTGDGLRHGNDHVAYVSLGYPKVEALTADWVIATSGGHANVLYVEITDSKVSEGYATTGALREFSSHCSGCTVTVVKTETVDLSTLPSLVSSTLVDHPNTNYVYPEFDIDVSEAISGIVSTTHSPSLVVASAEGLLSSMQRVASGNLQKVDVALNGNESGWAAVDQVLRMLKGLPVVYDFHIGKRVFTHANINSVPLTAAAANNGSWFGTPRYVQYFESLWK